ncbi:ATP-grasp domain-containing protein [Domibacillus tundrae]|uniref:ATP-grasp domain-containing protein n=1 Tax=Domibacillus tundrae TaxID=1587527 RepID=UPI003390FDE6
MKKNFMVLGGGAGQLAAIQKAQQLGMNVVVVDRDPACAGASLADFFEQVDTTNFEAVEHVARHYEIVGSMTMSNDVAVPTSCYINERLGLPMQGAGLVELMTDKYKMRKRYAEHHVNSPAFFEADSGTNMEALKDRLWMTGASTYIVKPSDGSGSQGITKISDPAQVKEAVQKALQSSRSGRVIVEEFIDGMEVGAFGFCMNGRMEYCFVHNDKVSNMIPVGHSFPSFLEKEQVVRIQEECEKALSSLGIDNGPTNIDLIINQQGVPYLIEIGARIPATRLPELVEVYAGIDLVTMTVQLAAGEAITCPLHIQSQPVAAEMLNFSEDGVIGRLEDYADLVDDFKPVNLEVDIQSGQTVSKLRSGRNHYGHVTFTGTSAEEAEAKCHTFLTKLKERIALEKTVTT